MLYNENMGFFEDIKHTYSTKSLFDDINPFGFLSAVKNIPELTNKICSNCGYNFNTFRETGFLGCSKCYQYFKNELSPYIEQIADGENEY
jgi:protein-arginine kinase activator protein McsA